MLSIYTDIYSGFQLHIIFSRKIVIYCLGYSCCMHKGSCGCIIVVILAVILAIVGLQDNLENRYAYNVTQSHFDGDNKETIIITCLVLSTCEAGICCFDNAVFETHIYIYTVGNYGDNDAVLYGLTISKTRASGSIFDRAKIYPDDEG